MNAQINAYYALLRQKAENRANENLDFALNNDEFKNEYYKLKDLDFKIATATVLNKTEEVKTLEVEHKASTENYLKLLTKLGLKESDLSPVYLCKKCNDSGFVNGKKMWLL